MDIKASLLPLLVWTIAVFGWEGVSWTGAFNHVLFPPPSSIAIALWKDLASGDLILHLGATLLRVALAFAVAVVFAIPAGLALGYSNGLYRVLGPPLDMVRVLPAIVLYLPLLLLLGIGDSSRVALAALSSGVILTLMTTYGARQVKAARREVFEALGARPVHLVFKLMLPEALPVIFGALRTSVSIALILVIVTEFVQPPANGIGPFLDVAKSRYHMDSYWGAVVMVALLGYGINQALEGIEHAVVHWRGQ